MSTPCTGRRLRENAKPEVKGTPHHTCGPAHPTSRRKPLPVLWYRAFFLRRQPRWLCRGGNPAHTLYRQTAVTDVVHFGERSNLVLAQGFFNVVREPIVAYLKDESAHHGRPLPPALERAIAALMEDTSVARVKIYDDEGVVTYSTRPTQIGRMATDNVGFQSAIQGQVASKLTYRDGFNAFDGDTESDNLIQSYIPVRAHPGAPILGVFEIYTDVNPMVAGIERAQLMILGGSTGILLLLYLSLLAIVRHAEGIIKRQQHSLGERSNALEVLSSQLLVAQEQEKQRVAHELHEGILQTLGSIKLQVEQATRKAGDGNLQTLRTVVPHLQAAIQDVRTLAMELRPSSLDELGVIATLNWYFRECAQVYPDAVIAPFIRAHESDISPSLKVILYRITQQVTQHFMRCDASRRVQVSLSRAAAGLRLQLTSNRGACAVEDADNDAWWLAIQERIALSGGNCTITRNDQGGVTLTALWPS